MDEKLKKQEQLKDLEKVVWEAIVELRRNCINEFDRGWMECIDEIRRRVLGVYPKEDSEK